MSRTDKKSSVPQHVAIIMDGNGRWAKKRFLPRAAGHRSGAKAVRKAVKFAIANQVEILTLFALSIENLNYRPKREIAFLLDLFLNALSVDMQEAHENNVQLIFIGDWSVFADKLQQKIHEAIALTRSNSGLKLILAINYSGRWDITRATKKIVQRVTSHQLQLADVNEQTVNSHLSLGQFKEPDLLIRTSGEQRVSNFLLWQLAYSELFFTDTYWPDFDDQDFQQAMDHYKLQERRFGLITEQLEEL